MKQIFGKGVLFTLSVCAVMNLSSCGEAVMDDVLTSEQNGGESRLTVTTRGDGDSSESTVRESRVYFFNDAGRCVQVISADEENNAFTVLLAAGTYTVLSVGGDNLSGFNLPVQSDATTQSVISLKDGVTMGDLLMKQSTLTMVKGQDQSETITLERKVTKISDIEIKEVPTDVTGVEVTLSPFYGAVCLDGTFPESPTTGCPAVTLTKQEDGTTWKAEPNLLSFPSAGNPTILVTLSKADGKESYSFGLTEPLNSNKSYSLSGTYKHTWGRLTMTMAAQAWGESQDAAFEFDADNMVFSNLVAGEFNNGYYVVSVNETNSTAVLLAQSKVVYNAPASGSNAAAWLAALTGPMASLDKPIGVTNNWRLPTSAETEVFSKDPQIVTFSNEGYSTLFFCEDDGTLKCGWTTKSGNDYSFHWGDSGFYSGITLRPVIDISF